MAVILIDSCIVTDLADPNSKWFDWSADTLEALERNNRLIINDIIYSECSIAYNTIEEIENLFSHLGFGHGHIPKEALFLAGKCFLKYKKNKGHKSFILPDFFIGAHAAVEGHKLITRDKGRFASYFPTVELIMP